VSARRGRQFVRRLTDRIQRPADQSDAETWQTIQTVRHAQRPYTLDLAARLFSDFEEIHGDRAYGDDPAIVAGVARYGRGPVVVIGHQKGRDAQERTYRNFGMPGPEGYRKGMRAMAIAERLDIPLITLIDTPGAFPGAGAEERGQGGAIALSMRTMYRLSVPVVAVVIGEGSSGGALALGVADRVLMLENSTYSVISPEGAAAILWRDAAKAPLAASAFKPTAANCYRLGIADGVVPEPVGGAHADHDEAARLLDGYLRRAIRELHPMTPEERRRQRGERYRRMGAYRELPSANGSALAGGRERMGERPGGTSTQQGD
jgi:acetyl-CoA carboxylase carboxyl transferase subunit alpha